MALDADGLWIDVDAFEHASADARADHEPSAYRAALALYGGELLPEDRYEEWTTARRDALRETHLALLVELGRAAVGPAATSPRRCRHSSGPSSKTRCTRRPIAR